MRITRDEFPELKLSNVQECVGKIPRKEVQEYSTQTSLDFKKNLDILVLETIKQLTDETKKERDVEDIYLIFKGQMMVVNKCKLLSTEDQQKQNAEVYACYYKRKFGFKKDSLKFIK